MAQQKRIKITLTDSERETLSQKAKIANRPLATVIRKLALGEDVFPKASLRSEEEKLALRELVGIGTNLNQIARNLNSDQLRDATNLITEMRKLQQLVQEVKATLRG